MLQPPAERIATCCSEAMSGYFEAALELWWAATNASIDTCGRMVKAAARADDTPRSWFDANAPLAPLPGTEMALDWFGCSTAVSPLVPGMPNIFDVWFDMAPMRGGPAAWPMAFYMLSAGVPKAVAWPAAAANAAMMEAAEVATGHIQGVFASYHSDSGYANAANANALTSVEEWMPVTPTIAAYRTHSR